MNSFVSLKMTENFSIHYRNFLYEMIDDGLEIVYFSLIRRGDNSSATLKRAMISIFKCLFFTFLSFSITIV